MPRCRRCGAEFTRLTVSQVHCPECQREVAAILEADRRRRVQRFVRVRDTTQLVVR
jgi:hypothetical protein